MSFDNRRAVLEVKATESHFMVSRFLTSELIIISSVILTSLPSCFATRSDAGVDVECRRHMIYLSTMKVTGAVSIQCGRHRSLSKYHGSDQDTDRRDDGGGPNEEGRQRY